MRNDYLRIIFYKKLSAYSQDTALINGTFDELLNLYSSGKRFYHDLTHIISLLKIWEDNRSILIDEEVVYLAIWFHDAYYESRKDDNEERSAEMAKSFLTQINFPAERIEKVCNYILATKTHQSDGDHDLNYFLDFDLSILGSDDIIYDIYTEQIRDEYKIYPSFLYNRGRKKVLNHFLEKTHIYHTDTFRAKLDNQARENIRRELESL